MREKYIEERFNRYFTFPPQDSYLTEIYDSRGFLATVESSSVTELLKDRDDVIDMLVKVAQKLDEVDSEAFKEIWYD